METIKTQLSNLYHWPEVLALSILDSSGGATNKPVGILHVKVIRALNLQKMDFLGKSDPYVKLSLSGERLLAKKTTIQMSNLNPVWNEQFKLIVKDPKTQVLELHVFDWERVKAHDKLGMQVIPLNSLPLSETKEFTLQLLKNLNPNDPQNRRNRGKIVVQLRFAPFQQDIHGPGSSLNGDERNISMKGDLLMSSGGILSLKVERAEDVKGKHHTNPYAVVLFRGEQRKTKRIKKCRNPRWNEEFHFMLEEPPIDQKIHIGVISRRRIIFLSKDFLGHVEINLSDVINNGRINERYHLINSRNGVIHVEMRWSTT